MTLAEFLQTVIPAVVSYLTAYFVHRPKKPKQ